MKRYHPIKYRKANLISFLIAVAIIGFVAVFFIHGGGFFRKKGEAPSAEKYKMRIVKAFPFSEANSLKEWEEKVFKDKVIYRIEKAEDLSYVKATSTASASALYYRIKLNAKMKHPVVSWKWKVEKFPVKKLPENLETKDEDDFAARVYVIFPALFFTNSKVLEYVWAETLPVGTTGSSPYSKNIKLIVLKSGLKKEGGWASEERDIVEDYKSVFGRTPEYDVGAVAFMTNTEHTGTGAEAMYDEIKVGYKEDAGNTKGKEAL